LLVLQVQQLCLPFLRIAALLHHHLYSHALPYIGTEGSEFVSLVFSLDLVTEKVDLSDFTAADALNWPGIGSETGRSWCEELVVFVNRSQISAHNILIDQHITWHQPRLLKLPHLYDKIFQVRTVINFYLILECQFFLFFLLLKWRNPQGRLV